MISEKKSLLFGSLPYPLSNEERHAAWKEIHEKAKSLGLVNSNKSWEYVRDVTWANWKRRTLEKRVHKKKTGTGGGSKVQYTEQDNMILDIIGRDTPLLEGLKVPESMENAAEPDYELLSLSSPLQQSTPTKPKSQSSLNPAPRVLFQIGGTNQTRLLEKEKGGEVITGASKSKVRSTKRHFQSELENEVHAKKIQLQLDLMEIDKRTKSIQLYKLERRYGLPACEFTKEFHDVIIDDDTY